MGGLARRANEIKSIRRERADVLLFDAGNSWWGAPGLAEKTGARVGVEAMNLMAYHAMALGASDLLLGESLLRERIAQAEFAVLSANLYVPASGSLLAQPYVIVQNRGHRVGVIGLTGEATDIDTGNSSASNTATLQQEQPPGCGSAACLHWDDLVVLDPQRELRRALDKIRDSADVIVVLSSLGWRDNVQLAESVDGVDLIISSGAGTDLVTKPWRSPSGTWLCQGGVIGQKRPGEILAEIYLQVDGAGQVTQAYGSETVLAPGIRNDPEMVRVLQSFRQ